MLATARRIPETRAVATLGAPADPRDVTGLLRDSLPAINVAGEAVVSIAGRQFRIRRQFLDDVAAQPQRERIRTLDAALLIGGNSFPEARDWEMYRDRSIRGFEVRADDVVVPVYGRV